jgi:glutathione S-transferase
LTAALLGLPLERRHYDILKGETRTSAFLASVNANGRIPVLQVGERFLPESNAACIWLAHGSAFIPQDRFDHADMMRWLFWEQYNHEPNIATVRFWRAFVGEAGLTDLQRTLLPGKVEAGHAALALMENALGRQEWLVAAGPSLADICLYAYTHVAPEGGFNLGDSPAIRRWIGRVEALPGYLRLDE